MSNIYKRGQIYFVNSGNEEPIGSEIWPDRPALIISNDVNNKYSSVVNVVYLTTSPKRKSSPTHVRVHSNDKYAIALCEQVHSVDKSRLGDCIGSITEEEMKEVNNALQFALSIGNNDSRISGIFKKWEHYINKYGMNTEEKTSKEKTETDAIIKNLTAERDCYKKLYELQIQRTNNQKGAECNGMD